MQQEKNTTSKSDPDQMSVAKGTGAKSETGAVNGSTAKLFKSLIAAQNDLKNVKTNAKNSHFKSKYATLDEVRDAVVPVLAKHGLAITQPLDVIDGKLFLITRLIHESGEYQEGKYPIQFDKPQVMGSAITYARRYNLSSVCNIASEIDDDGNAASSVKETDDGFIL